MDCLETARHFRRQGAGEGRFQVQEVPFTSWPSLVGGGFDQFPTSSRFVPLVSCQQRKVTKLAIAASGAMPHNMAALPKALCRSGTVNTQLAAPRRPMLVSMPCAEARNRVGKSSAGSIKVVAFGPMLRHKLKAMKATNISRTGPVLPGCCKLS